MAQRRMFSKKITETDKFLDMPASSQNLYFHLNMNADDEGFIDNIKTVKRTVGSSDDDIKLLIAKQFIIPFESGIVVIKDWRIHNYIQKDRFQPTLYKKEKALLKQMNAMDTECIQDVSIMEPQVRLGKDSLGKDRLGKDSEKNISVVISDHCQNHGIFIDGQQLIMLEEFHLLDNMDIDVICKAITESADNGKRNFKYILAILRNWKQDGIKSMSQVEERERQYLEKKTNIQTKTNVPDWSNPDYKEPDFLEFALGDCK